MKLDIWSLSGEQRKNKFEETLERIDEAEAQGFATAKRSELERKGCTEILMLLFKERRKNTWRLIGSYLPPKSADTAKTDGGRSAHEKECECRRCEEARFGGSAACDRPVRSK